MSQGNNEDSCPMKQTDNSSYVVAMHPWTPWSSTGILRDSKWEIDESKKRHRDWQVHQVHVEDRRTLGKWKWYRDTKGNNINHHHLVILFHLALNRLKYQHQFFLLASSQESKYVAAELVNCKPWPNGTKEAKWKARSTQRDENLIIWFILW